MSRSTSTEGLTRGQVRSAYLAACRAELQALKPGNVHVFAVGHGMSIADFETSALASAGALSDPRDRKSTRLNSSHLKLSRMPSSA